MKMRVFLLFLFLINVSDQIYGQTETDSLEYELPETPNQANYVDNDSLQYYNYSGMWDFDGDGVNDSLLLVGDHGAHVHYYPKIITSADSSVFEFKSFLIDMPWPETKKETIGIEGSLPVQLVIDNFDVDPASEIYIRIDPETWRFYQQSKPQSWKAFDINSNSLLLNFEDDKMLPSDFVLNQLQRQLFFDDYRDKGVLKLANGTGVFNIVFDLHGWDCGTPDCFQTDLTFTFDLTDTVLFPLRLPFLIHEYGCVDERRFDAVFTLQSQSERSVFYRSNDYKLVLVLFSKPDQLGQYIYLFEGVNPALITERNLSKLLDESWLNESIQPYTTRQMKSYE